MLKEAMEIVTKAIEKNMPQKAVKEKLKKHPLSKGQGRLLLVSVGKAAWSMANAAYESLGEEIDKGIVITKYHHSKGPIGDFQIFEGGHPVLDENSILATEKVLKMTNGLKKEDTVLFLLSGGGSALFEKPVIPLQELEEITAFLLKSGAEITQINTLRKGLSQVKGGRFAKWCIPGKVITLVLSDIIGNPLDMIASGPSVVDTSTYEQALSIVKTYNIPLSKKAQEALKEKRVTSLDNSETYVIGSVEQLCLAAKEACEVLGYQSQILTTSLDCQAKEAGAFLGAIARDHQQSPTPLAFIAGGETVVRVIGKGKGGRNQEMALSAAPKIADCKNTAIFCVGSDGTDGPTDGAGGYVDEYSLEKLHQAGYKVDEVLRKNNAYPVLKEIGGLIVTGPTGTNVNDVAVVLVKGNKA